MANTLIAYKQLNLVGKLVDADISSSAAIATAKLAEGTLFAKKNVTNIFTANQDLGSNKIINLANGTASNDAVNFGQLDGTRQNLQTQIDSLSAAVAIGLKTPLPFDASVNATFPSMPQGTTYKVTVAGVTSGIKLQVGDTIIYDGAGTTNTPYVVQTNIDEATETVTGTIRIATQAEVTTGTNTTAAVVPAYLQAKLTAFQTSLLSTTDSRYVRFDTSQSLNSTQQTQARTNIGAAADSEVVKLTGNQTIANIKTFTSSPVIPDATASNQAVSKGQMDAAILAAGTTNLIVNETPSGLINGSNTVYNLANTPVVGKVLVFLNGQQIYVTNDYTISGATITFVTAPESGDVIRSTYVKA